MHNKFIEKVIVNQSQPNVGCIQFIDVKREWGRKCLKFKQRIMKLIEDLKQEKTGFFSSHGGTRQEEAQIRVPNFIGGKKCKDVNN